MNITMDITSVSGASAFQQLSIGNNVATAVAAKSLQAQRTQGAAAEQLLEASEIKPESTNGSGKVDVKA